MADEAPLSDWKARSRANLEADDWVSPPPGVMRAHPPEATPSVLQEAFDPRRHPRGRRGRWRDVPQATRLAMGDVHDIVLSAYNRLLPVTVTTHTGETFTGNVRSAGPQAVTLEDRDGNGRRFAWDKLKDANITDATEKIKPLATPPTVPEPVQTGMPDHLGLGPKTYDPDIAAINTYQDAEAVFAKMGLEAKLEPRHTGKEMHSDNLSDRLAPGGNWTVKAPSADFYRQITQAVRDAKRNFPALTNGRIKFGGVLFNSNLEHTVDAEDGEGADGVWGTTGPDPRLASMNPRSYYEGNPNAPVYIVLNENDFEFSDTMSESGGAAVADRIPYGRMTHELGHAVSYASGFATDASIEHYGESYIDGLTEHDLPPVYMELVSRYGASNPAEAWAEAFTTLHTAGALDRTISDGREEITNEAHDVPGGREMLPRLLERVDHLRPLLEGLRGFTYKGQVLV